MCPECQLKMTKEVEQRKAVEVAGMKWNRNMRTDEIICNSLHSLFNKIRKFTFLQDNFHVLRVYLLCKRRILYLSDELSFQLAVHLFSLLVDRKSLLFCVAGEDEINDFTFSGVAMSISAIATRERMETRGAKVEEKIETCSSFSLLVHSFSRVLSSLKRFHFNLCTREPQPSNGAHIHTHIRQDARNSCFTRLFTSSSGAGEAEQRGGWKKLI